MGYVKKIMEIGSGDNSIATEDVFGISGEFDIDALCGTLSFNLPYTLPLPDSTTPQYLKPEAGIDITRLKKFDTVKLYFIETDSAGEIIQTSSGYFVNGYLMSLIFDGFIDQIKLNKSKTNINYEITALGTLGLANYRNLEYQHKTGTAGEMILTVLQISGLQIGQFNVLEVQRDLIPADKVRFIDVDVSGRVIVIDGGTPLKDVLEQIRKKYALIIHQSGDGYVNVMTPYYLLKANTDSTLSVNAWNFDLNLGNAFEIDYGDLTQTYNAIVVLGQPGIYGVALDPIAVANNNGVVNYLVFESRNLASDEECQKVARDKLLEMERNYFVTFKTKFMPDFMIGQPFTLKDNDRYTGNETLLIKKYSFTIDKSDVSCTIQGYMHGATLIPEDVALSNTGVLDVDILQIRDKELDTTQWKQIGGVSGD